MFGSCLCKTATALLVVAAQGCYSPGATTGFSATRAILFVRNMQGCSIFKALVYSLDKYL
jgi:hypothetical protein